jgi:hypothetical protein
VTALVAIFGALTLVGIVLTVKTLFPGRTGDTPYCRKCRYNLTGLDLTAKEPRCPECGSGVTEAKAVLRGERHRRPGWVASAVICLLLGLTPLVVIAIGALRQVDWYTYKPTAWVLKDIESNDAKLAAKAINEMTRRWQADELTPEQTLHLGELCLAEHSRPVVRAQVHWKAENLLYALFASDLLAPDQTERYLRDMIVGLRPKVRPIVVKGEEFFVGASFDSRGALNKFDLTVKIAEIRFGRRPTLRPRAAGLGLGSGYGANSIGTHVVLDQPGTSPVELDLEYQINHAYGSQLYSAKRTLTAEVEVLAEEPPHLFTLTHSPELDREVAAAVRATDFRPESTTWSNGRPQPGLSVEVWFYEPFPIGLAFVAYAEVGNRWLPAEPPIVLSTGGTSGARHSIPVTFEYPGELPETVTLILCTSESAATRTPDLYQIWDGELVFEDIPVSASSRPGGHFGDGRYAPTIRHPEVPQPTSKGNGQP